MVLGPGRECPGRLWEESEKKWPCEGGWNLRHLTSGQSGLAGSLSSAHLRSPKPNLLARGSKTHARSPALVSPVPLSQGQSRCPEGSGTLQASSWV